MSGRRIAVTGGGTAGHARVGLALMKRYAELHGADAFFIGSAEGMEGKVLELSGQRFFALPALPYAREGWLGKGAAVLRALASVPRAARLLRGTALLIGVGGYPSMGVVLAAWLRRIPVVLHEANARPGLANRVLARLARRVCIGFAEAAPYFRAGSAVVTGTPCGEEVYRRAPRAVTGERRMLVMGGSVGSRFLDREVPALLGALARSGMALRVQHLTGEGDAVAVREAYAAGGVEAIVEPYRRVMAELYRDADFVIAAPGAVTLAEIAAAGLPALLVPLSWAADDHQQENARGFAAVTGCPWVTEGRWNRDAVRVELAETLRDLVLLAGRGIAVQRWHRDDSAGAVVAVCESIA